MTALLNKKILLSLGVIVFAVAVAISSTGAFFSDSETSTGNTFTAGAIDLKVDSTSHYNHMVCTNSEGGYTWQPEVGFVPGPDQFPATGTSCSGTWTLKDLEPTLDKFFNFADVKPGDSGENTVSLHIDNNDAYACVDITNIQNNDNTCNDPESDASAPDAECNLAGTDLGANNLGELGQNLNFIVWKDDGAVNGFGQEGDTTEGDNIWQEGEDLLASGAAPTTNQSYTLAGPGFPLAGASTGYVGVQWCAGDFSNIAPGATCDGSGLGNEAQTDSYSADISFRVEQARNNPNFSCVPEVAPETATVTLDKVVTFTNLAVAGVDVSDFTLHLVGPGGDHILTDQVAFPGLTPGAYTVYEVYSGIPADATSTAIFSGSCVEIGTTDTATFNVVAGINPTCTITNSVSTTTPIN